jgi:hypothetical protein
MRNLARVQNIPSYESHVKNMYAKTDLIFHSYKKEGATSSIPYSNIYIFFLKAKKEQIIQIKDMINTMMLGTLCR